MSKDKIYFKNREEAAYKLLEILPIDSMKLEEWTVIACSYGGYEIAKIVADSLDAEFDIIFGEGISKIGEIIDMGVELGIVNKSGSWFSYDSNKLGQGRDSVKQLLMDNPEMANEIEAKIRVKLDEAITGVAQVSKEEA